MNTIKPVFIIGLFFFILALLICIGAEGTDGKTNSAETKLCKCMSVCNSAQTSASETQPVNPQQIKYAATDKSFSNIRTENPAPERGNSRTDSFMVFEADLCNQFCDCAPNNSMPNGWNRQLSSTGFWEHCWPCTLLRWSLSGLPENITINEVIIKLYSDNRWGNITGQLYYAPVTSQWDRTVTYIRRPETDTSMAGGIAWPNTRQWFEFDITTLAQKWIDGTMPNFGIELYSLNSTRTGGFDIRTPGWGNPLYHPKLVVTYEDAQESNEPINYFGQEPPGMIPEVFAPGIISLPDRDEAHCIFSPDGKELLLSVTPAGDWANAEILYSTEIDGQWTEPETAPFSNIGTCNIHAAFTSEAEKVFFSSNRDFPGQFDTDIWMTERTESGWTEPARLPVPVSSQACEWSPSVTSDGIIYFSSYRDGGVERSGYNPDIWRAIPTEGDYITVENIGAPVNAGSYDIWNVFVGPDESYIIYMEERPGINGDLYISFRDADDSWTIPEKLGPEINTGNVEKGPCVSPDGKYLFFSRSESGRTGDIYWVDINAVPGFEVDPNDIP